MDKQEVSSALDLSPICKFFGEAEKAKLVEHSFQELIQIGEKKKAGKKIKKRRQRDG